MRLLTSANGDGSNDNDNDDDDSWVATSGNAVSPGKEFTAMTARMTVPTSARAVAAGAGGVPTTTSAPPNATTVTVAPAGNSTTSTSPTTSASPVGVVIVAPNEFDVVCSRDNRSSSNHPGNELYRFVLQCAFDEYVRASKHDKMFITKRIVDTMRTSYGTRFVRMVKNTNKTMGSSSTQLQTKCCHRWEVISDEQARDKTSHALRFMMMKKKNQHQQQQEQEQARGTYSSSTGSVVAAPSQGKTKRNSRCGRATPIKNDDGEMILVAVPSSVEGKDDNDSNRSTDATRIMHHENKKLKRSIADWERKRATSLMATTASSTMGGFWREAYQQPLSVTAALLLEAHHQHKQHQQRQQSSSLTPMNGTTGTGSSAPQTQFVAPTSANSNIVPFTNSEPADRTSRIRDASVVDSDESSAVDDHCSIYRRQQEVYQKLKLIDVPEGYDDDLTSSQNDSGGGSRSNSEDEDEDEDMDVSASSSGSSRSSSNSSDSTSNLGGSNNNYHTSEAAKRSDVVHDGGTTTTSNNNDNDNDNSSSSVSLPSSSSWSFPVCPCKCSHRQRYPDLSSSSSSLCPALFLPNAASARVVSSDDDNNNNNNNYNTNEASGDAAANLNGFGSQLPEPLPLESVVSSSSTFTLVQAEEVDQVVARLLEEDSHNNDGRSGEGPITDKRTTIPTTAVGEKQLESVPALDWDPCYLDRPAATTRRHDASDTIAPATACSTRLFPTAPPPPLPPPPSLLIHDNIDHDNPALWNDAPMYRDHPVVLY